MFYKREPEPPNYRYVFLLSKMGVRRIKRKNKKKVDLFA